MANFPTSLPSATPADHGEVVGEVVAIATTLLAAWTSVTPTFVGFTTSSVSARYRVLGKSVEFAGTATLNSAVSAGMTVSLPVAAHALWSAYPVGIGYAAGVGNYLGEAELVSSTLVAFVTSASSAGYWANTNPFTWGSGHVLRWNVRYEAA